jgi:hypothetical protein
MADRWPMQGLVRLRVPVSEADECRGPRRVFADDETWCKVRGDDETMDDVDRFRRVPKF